jgi:acyl-CoA thioester hydrolase
MDSQVHVNNAVYLTYFEQARCDHLARAGLVVRGGDEGPVVAQAELRWRNQVAYPGAVRVYLRNTGIRRDSYRAEYAVYDEESGTLAADGSTLLIWADFKTGKRAPLPREWVDMLKKDIPAQDGDE